MRNFRAGFSVVLIGLWASAASAQSLGTETPVQPSSQAEIGNLRKAADQGDGSAQFRLASRYAEGHGVPQDYVLAHMWANLATSQSSGDDQKKYSELRDALAGKMTTAQIAEAQKMAREWERKAGADQPVAPAQETQPGLSSAIVAPTSSIATSQQSAAPSRKGVKSWQRATVTEISDERVYVGSNSGPGNLPGGTTAQYRRVWTYTIDAGNVVYVVKGTCGKILDAPCRLTVNGPVEIAVGLPPASFRDRLQAREGELVYLKDESGKEYTLVVAKKILKP